jgi:hypothetical protein
MAYFFKQKLNMGELSGLARDPRKILIYEPEEYLGALYAHYLKEHNFDVKHCPDLKKIKQIILGFDPELLIYSADSELSAQSQASFFRNLSLNFPSLRVVTTGYNLSSENVREFMSAGVSSHINRRFSRPKDLAFLAKTLLNN